MRYPTEAEWEHATRAGTTTEWFFGSDGLLLAAYANFADVSARHVTLRISNLDDGHAYSAPVGSFQPNPFGLHDVYGNVGEWCSDLFLPNYALLPDNARSARRHAVQGNAILGSLGVRPARAIE